MANCMGVDSVERMGTDSLLNKGQEFVFFAVNIFVVWVEKRLSQRNLTSQFVNLS